MAANKKDKQGSQQEDSWLQKLKKERQNRRVKEKKKKKGRKPENESKKGVLGLPR